MSYPGLLTCKWQDQVGQFCRSATPSFPQHTQAWGTVPALRGGPVACPAAGMVPGGESCPSGSGGLSPFSGAGHSTRAGPVLALVTAPWEHPGCHREM